jgi:hypothetical protein
MPRKNPEAERFGGPGSSSQDRSHPEKTGRRSALPNRAAQRTADHPRCPAAEANGTSIILTIPATEADQPDASHQGLGEGDGPGVEERRWKSLQPSNGHFFLQALVGGIESGERSPILCIERQRITRHEKDCILRDHHPHRRGLLCRCPDALVNGRNQRRWHYKAR